MKTFKAFVDTILNHASLSLPQNIIIIFTTVETRATRTPAFWGYPHRPLITHTIDQFVLNPKSILLTSSYRIPSQKKVKAEKNRKIWKKFKFYNFVINLTRNTPSNGSDYFLQIWKLSIENWKRYRADTIFKVKVKWPWRYRSRSKVITRDTPSHASDHLYQIWKESIQNCRRYRADTIFKVKVEWPWRYRSRSKVITCDTPSHASDHLYQIWKESIKNCRCYRVDTIFKAKAKWPWRYRSRSKVIICNTLSHTSDHLYQIWKESIESCRFYFSRSRPKNFKNLLEI